jgi:hypothetical protein
MNATYLKSSLAPSTTQQTGVLRTILVEPLLVVASGAFWLFALPLVAVSLACVKAWDAFVALNSSNAATPNPLILRSRRQVQDVPAFSSSSEIWATSHI